MHFGSIPYCRKCPSEDSETWPSPSSVAIICLSPFSGTIQHPFSKRCVNGSFWPFKGSTSQPRSWQGWPLVPYRAARLLCSTPRHLWRVALAGILNCFFYFISESEAPEGHGNKSIVDHTDDRNNVAVRARFCYTSGIAEESYRSTFDFARDAGELIGYSMVQPEGWAGLSG